ncbi:MAG: hypothetical protein Kow0068_12640 [Marinilabiliales bacterium]
MKTVLALFLSLLFFGGVTLINPLVSDVPDEIIVSLKTGNSKTLAKYFNSNLELQILDDENVYSKSQAEIMIDKFFKENIPSGFSIIHQGGTSDAKYIIGNLTTSKGVYRVYFLLKESNGKPLIHELRIEENE